MKNWVIVVLLSALLVLGTVVVVKDKSLSATSQDLKKAEKQVHMGLLLHEVVAGALREDEELHIVMGGDGAECLIIPSTKDRSLREFCRGQGEINFDSGIYDPNFK